MKFEAGQKIRWEGQVYEICFMKSRQIILLHISTGMLQAPVNQSELEKSYLDRTLIPQHEEKKEQPMGGLLFSDLSEFQRKTIIDRMHFVNRFLVGDVTIHNDKQVVEEVAKEIGYKRPVSVSTVRRWLGIYKETSDIKSLVDRRHPLTR